MIRALLLLTASLLSACQADDAVPSNETAGGITPEYSGGITPEYVASLPAGQSRPIVQQLANQVVAAEMAACNDNPNVDWDACVSTQMLIAFDRYGFLANHCRDKPDHRSLRDCVQFGRSGVDWLLAQGGNPDVDFDWSNPEESHDRALRQLNQELTGNCVGKPEEQGNSCFTSLSARLLRLSDMVAQHCAARQTLEQRGACIIDAHDTAMYQAALAVLAR
jgi:hypothetical protein